MCGSSKAPTDRRGHAAALPVSFLLFGLALNPCALAEPLPEQMLFEPLLAPSALATGHASIELALSVYDFPDDRRGEDYRLRSVWRPRERHHLSLELHYVGIEDDARMNNAGGPLGLGWSMELLRLAGVSWGSDARVFLPVGDGEFHPLSAKASSIEWNIRGGVRTESGQGLWVSWWMRRVSQPTDRVDPQRFFPSGSGATVHGDLKLGATTLRLLARQDLGGPSSALWLGARATQRIADELILGASVGASSPGESAGERLFDRGWSIFFRWSPPPLETP